MKREFHAPFCERPGVQFLRPTHHSLQLVLDVGFGEDQSRLRKGFGAKNMAVVRNFAFNLVRSAKDKKSIKLRRKVAGWTPDYLDQLLSTQPC